MQTQFGYFNTIVIKDISYCLSMQSLTEPQVPVDLTSGGCEEGREGRAPRPRGSKFFQFHAVFGKIWQNRMLVPSPRGLAPPPRGNPESATVNILI